MSDISERLVVHCPDREASGHLAAFFREHTAGGFIQMTLRLPINVFTDRRALLERRVTATLAPLRSIDDPRPTYSVTWSPMSPGQFVEFHGALAVERSALDDCFGLVACGHYAAPVHGTDERCNPMVEERIAHACARNLLHVIAEHVERACAHDEAARAGNYARPRGIATYRHEAEPVLVS